MNNVLAYFQEILSFSEIDDDISSELSVDAVIFPLPKRTDVTWKVVHTKLIQKGKSTKIDEKDYAHNSNQLKKLCL